MGAHRGAHFIVRRRGDCCRARLGRRRPVRIPPWLIKYLPASGARAASRHSSGRSTWCVP
jgi:hypothetical protein